MWIVNGPRSTVPDDGEGRDAITAADDTAPFCPRGADVGADPRVVAGAGREVPEQPVLQQDLQGHLDGAAALEQRHREVEVDLVRRGQHSCGLDVVPRAL